LETREDQREEGELCLGGSTAKFEAHQGGMKWDHRSRRPNPYSRAGWLDYRLSFNITSIAYCVCTFSQKDLKSALSRRYLGTSVHAKVYWYNGGISDLVCRYRYDTGETLTKCSKGNLSISLDSRVASGDISRFSTSQMCHNWAAR
jgi:hypothetical protein